jgi:hypothetical protein
MTDKYIFSIIVGDEGGFVPRPNEFELNLMVTTEELPRYVFRIRKLGEAENVVFEEATHFPFSDKLIDIMLLRTFYSFRVLKSQQGKVQVIRVFSKNENIELELANGRFSSRLAIENEQALLDLMQSALGRIVIEPGIQNPLASRYKRRWGDMKYRVPSRRSLAPEQRYDAQSLTDVVHTSGRSMTANPILAISDSLVVDTKVWTFNKRGENTSFSFTPIGGFFNYTRGCGRKRTISAMLEAISSGHIDDSSVSETRIHSNLNKYFARKLAIVVCEDDRVEKWSQELTGEFLTISNKGDLDLISYELISKGITLVIANSVIPFIQQDAFETLQQVHKMTILADHRARELDDTYYQRVHVSSIAERLPHSRASLGFLTSRCVVSDFKDKNRCILESSIIAKVFEADWTWICLGYDGIPPSHLPLSYIQLAKPILFPTAGENERIKNELNRGQILPDFWRIINDPYSGIVQYLTIPKTILRRVTLVLDRSATSEKERSFMQTITKIRQSMTAVPVPPISAQSSAVLLGMKYDNIAACQVHLALPRTGPLTQSNAERNLDEHFSEDSRGTLAQRVGAGATERAAVPIGTLSEASFVKRALKEKGDGICQVCYADPVTTITLCGHCFCSACAAMLRVNEARGGGVTSCPVCRAALSSYDWITVGEQSSEILHVPSKVRELFAGLASVFSKRRHKKRSPMTAWIVVPKEAYEVVIKQLKEGSTGSFEIFDSADLNQSESSMRQQIPRVVVIPFEELSKTNEIGDHVDALFMTCPSANSVVYYDLLRSCETRTSPLQLFLLVSQGLETAAEPLSIFV